MTEVVRYDMVVTELRGGPWQELRPAIEGDWVLWDDYIALRVHVVELEQQLARREEDLESYAWTTEKPTIPGWYWWRFDAAATHAPECTFVADWRIARQQEWIGEWAGPIPMPKEAT